jgi:hypothetical protein
LNRFVWDLRYERPQALRYGYSIAAVYGEDAIMVPEGPLVLPESYRVKLTLDGRSYTAPLKVMMDPRVKIPALALSQQLGLEMKIIAAMKQSYLAVKQIRDLRAKLKDLQDKLKSDASAGAVLEALNSLDKKAAELIAVEQQYPPVGIVSVASLNGALSSLLLLVDSSDSAPTSQAVSTFATYQQLFTQQLAKWAALKDKDLAALNALLRQRQLSVITIKSE